MSRPYICINMSRHHVTLVACYTSSHTHTLRVNTHDAIAIIIETRSSAVAERPRNASCHWLFRKVTQDHV